MGIIIPPEDAGKALGRFSGPDVVIVGTGPAGVVSALELAKAGLQVLMLEAGSEALDTDGSPFFNFEVNGPSHEVAFGMSLQMGGSTNLWSGRSARFEAGDITMSRGWPFDREDLEDDYRHAEEILGIELENADQQPEIPAGWKSACQRPLEIKRFTWSRPPRNFADVARRAVERFPELNVILGARCVRLNYQGGVLQSLSVATSDGVQSVSARRFLLAAGGLESPRVMLASGLGEGLPALGRYLGTHPKGNVGKLELRRLARLRYPLFSDTKIGDHWRRYGVGLEHSSRPAGLNHYLQLSPRFEKIGSSMLERAQQGLLAARGPSTGRNRLEDAAILAGRVAFNALGRSGVFQGYASQLTLRGFFDQHPDPSNRIELQASADKFGVPQAAVQWKLGQHDYDSISAFMRIISEHISRSDIGEVRADLPHDPGELRLTGVHSHFMGTTRMGTGPGDSVVDGWGRVHGQERLFVSGPGLFRTYSYANPVLTICALALRVARGVIHSLQEERA